MRHGILPALGAAALIAPALRAQATPSSAPARDVQEQMRKALEQRVREQRQNALEEGIQRFDSLRKASQSLLLDDSLDREALRRQLLARIDRRIAEAMERLRTEIHAIVEEELARTEPGVEHHLTFDRSEIPEGMEALGPTTPWMGVELASKEGAESLNVKRVIPVSPAAEAGLREGDRILSVLGVPVADRAQLGAVLATRMPGDRIEVKVRRGGEEVVLFVVLGFRPEEEERGIDEDDDEARLAAERVGAAREARFGEDPEAIKIGFEEFGTGKPPKGWSFARTGEGPEGKWTVENDGENSVLKQSSADPTDFRFPIAVLDGKTFD
ncbi:MAG TPA: PDZ domain-containing protein, partial [Planctomycetota bacterium]|nr:PDZ domain-containing protein [Planctomycetota bacterium]